MMADSSKRQFEQNVQTKRQKVENVNGVCKNILDVNKDCLDHIFNHLDVMDLVNLAEANKQLGQTAVSVFARKCKRRAITFDLKKKSLNSTSMFEMTDDNILICDPLLTFKTLRLFGASILTIKLVGEFTKKIDKILMSYANTYCCDTLETFSIENGPTLTYADTKKPYKNVKNIHITGKIDFNGSQFNDTFPNMHHLVLECAIFPDHTSFATKFNKLASLFVDLRHIDFDTTDEKALTRSDIKEIVRLNPQIIELGTNYDLKFWEYANQHLKQLKHISINFKPNEFNKLSQPIRFESVKELSLIIREIDESLNPKMVFSFKHLEYCLLTGHFDKFWFNLVIENQSIEKLNIVPYRSSKYFDQDIAILAEKLPKLTELRTIGCSWSVDSVIKFLNECSTLRKFTIENFFNLPNMKKLYSRMLMELPNWSTTESSVCDCGRRRSIVIERK